MKVIAVDDDDQFRRMLSDELTEYGFDVTTFSDGAALFAAPSLTAAADLIVLDWSLWVPISCPGSGRRASPFRWCS